MMQEYRHGQAPEPVPEPHRHSDVLEAHFRLQDETSFDDFGDLASTAELPEATESAESIATRPHNEWERDWIERMRQAKPDEAPSFSDTNNFWNYFRPNIIVELRKTLRTMAAEKRDGDLFGVQLQGFEAQMYAWITSGVMNEAIKRFGTERMERLLENVQLLEILWARSRVNDTTPGAREFQESVRQESAVLLCKLAVVMYDLGVPSSAIFG